MLPSSMRSGGVVKSPQQVTFQEFLDFSEIGPDVVHHLSKVYRLLAFVMIVSVFGCALQIKNGLMEVMQWPYVLALFCILIALHSNTCVSKERVIGRVALCGLFGLLQGVITGPLVAMVLHMDAEGYRIVQSAFLLTTSVFVALTLTSFLTGKRSFLYAGSALNSFLFFILIVNIFPTYFSQNISLYGGLFVFMGYVVFDTQKIIACVERYGVNNVDFVTDAMTLYIDFVAIFVRILIILARSRKDGSRTPTASFSRTAAPKIDL